MIPISISKFPATDPTIGGMELEDALNNCKVRFGLSAGIADGVDQDIASWEKALASFQVESIVPMPPPCEPSKPTMLSKPNKPSQ